MKCVILAIFAALLMGLFTATQAEAADPLGVGETIQAEVEANLTMRVDPAGTNTWKQPTQAGTVEVMDTGTVIATWEEVRLAESPELFAFFFDGDMDNRVPQSKPFNIAVPPQEPNQVALTYHITVEFGLGEPLVVVTPGLQQHYWGPVCHWEGCDAFGVGPYPPGDWSTQAAYQSVPFGALGEDLKGCRSVLKPGNNEPLVCIEPGWEP